MQGVLTIVREARQKEYVHLNAGARERQRT
jgi:hypothetical protein